MMRQTIIILFLFLLGTNPNIYAQDADYLKKAYELLKVGDKEKAIKAYEIYKKTQKKTNVEFEKQLRAINNKEAKKTNDNYLSR